MENPDRVVPFGPNLVIRSYFRNMLFVGERNLGARQNGVSMGLIAPEALIA
jgi:hypothetical protein